ncbi:efflux RND transporter periplasmic adaptor subunit [Colwelliaceae bacterium 6471]
MKSLLTIFTLIFCITSVDVTANNYDLEEVVVEPFKDVIHRTGKLDFKRTLNLSFKSNGYLSQLSVDEGDYFEKDQLLASLDVAELKAQKNSTYSQLLQAKRDVKRITQLMENNLSSEQELDVAVTKVDTLRANYKIAFYNLQKAQVIAPFSGVVLARYTELGELQSPGREILKVAALKDNWVVKVALTGIEVSQVRLNQKVQVKLHSIGMIEGVISRIPAIANTQGQLFMIDVLLPELPIGRGIVAGQIADVKIEFSSNDFVYRLPIEALVSVDENGNALVMTQLNQENSIVQQAFDIYKLDNNFLYLYANQRDKPLSVVTSGWQHMNVSVQ